MHRDLVDVGDRVGVFDVGQRLGCARQRRRFGRLAGWPGGAGGVFSQSHGQDSFAIVRKVGEMRRVCDVDSDTQAAYASGNCSLRRSRSHVDRFVGV